MTEKKYRLITRMDFDGVVCGALLRELGMTSSVEFAEPGDVQHGRVAITADDITANLPYAPDAHLCFDHHWSEMERVGKQENFVIDPNAPSAARVIYEYFGGEHRFPNISEALMDAVDKADAAQFTEAEVLAPEGWTLLNFVLDGRTGLGNSQEFSVTTEQLMSDLMGICRHTPIDEILELPDVLERVNAYWYQKEFGERQIAACGRMVGNTVVCDMRGEDVIHPVDRFMIYAVFPDSDLSITLKPADDNGIVEIACGKSIFKRTSKVNVGTILLQHGGGGHAAAGTCRIPADKVDGVLNDILAAVAEQAA